MPLFRRRCWVLLSSACLAACATTALQLPDPVTIPSGWSVTEVSNAGGSASLAQWWLRLNDPVLTGLVQQALQANTSVQAALANLRQARALRDVAAAGLLPNLSASASAQRSHSGGGSSGTTGPTGTYGASTSNNFQVGLDASWELDLFGGQRAGVAAAQSNAAATAATLGDVQVSISAELALDYVLLRASQARLAIAQTNLATQMETSQLTQWRLQAGLVSSLEAEQARSAAEQLQAQIPALQSQIEQASHALAVLTGQPPAALTVLFQKATPIPHAADDLALSFPAQTLRQRADVRAAELQVFAAASRVTQADAARFPSVNLGGSLGVNALTLGGLGNGSALAASVLASISLPLFDGGAARAQVTAQQAALDLAASNYKAAILTALKDVEDALVALRADRQRLAHLVAAADAASNAALMARQRYASGLTDFQTVLDTQRSQLTTQDSVASATADLASDHVRLYKALGGGWQPDGGCINTAPNPEKPCP